jgi:hypothetical protein
MKKEDSGIGDRMDDFQFVVISQGEEPKKPAPKGGAIRATAESFVEQALPPHLRRQG